MKKWKYTEIDDSYYIDTIDDVEIAYLNNGKYLNTKENAHLIATAPELLKASEEIINFYDDEGWLNYLEIEEFDKLRKAINKAKGGDK